MLMSEPDGFHAAIALALAKACWNVNNGKFGFI